MTDFFVRAEANAERGMGQGGILRDACDKRHDFGDTRLVVGAQQRSSVGADKVLTHQVVEGRKFGGAHGHGLAVDDAANQIAALVVHDVRRYAGARRDLGGIKVRDQAQGGLILGTGASGNVRADIGVSVTWASVAPSSRSSSASTLARSNCTVLDGTWSQLASSDCVLIWT